MKWINCTELNARLALGVAAGLRRLGAVLSRERGDVPGWVLVTLMTAGLVAALWVVAKDSLVGVFNDAISKVTGTV